MRYYLLASLFVLFITSCVTKDEKKSFISERHGGVLKINETEYSWNLNPHNITSQVDKNIANQIYEGLVKYNPKNLTLAPALTKYWIFTEGGKKYTFFLRTNAYFHENACFNNPEKARKVNALDFKYSFEKLCTHSEYQTSLPEVMEDIVGAENYFNATKNNVKPRAGIKGIKVVNDSTLNIIVKAPNSLFINLLADLKMVVMPKEAIEMYGEEIFVGCGPFYLAEKPFKSEKLILSRNENYFFNDNKGNPLPYFNKIEITFVKSIEKEIELFEQENLDIVFGIPATIIPPFLDKHKTVFKSENPLYILSKDKAGGMEPIYILQHSYLKNFTSNRHNFIDFTRVYFEKQNQED